MVLASILGKTETSMRVSGSTASGMEMVKMCSLLETSMLANTSLEKPKATVSIDGATEIFTPVSSSTV